MDVPEPSLEQQARFLSRLAARLVADEHDSEDLAQDLWLAAAGRGGDGHAVSIGEAWFVRVLRNRRANLLRDRAHRDDRERAVARSESSEREDPAQWVREVETRELVARAVAELGEPYRTALHLRYFRDMGPAEIARQLGVSVKTVDSRLERARAKVRERLTREMGDRDAWIAAVLPWCSPPFALPPRLPEAASLPPFLVLGALTMKSTWVLTAALACLCALAVGLLVKSPEDPEVVAPRQLASGSSSVRTQPTPPAAGNTPAAATRVIAGKAPSDQDRPAVAAWDPVPKTVDLTAIVLDLDEQPIPAVGISLELADGTRRSARSDAHGQHTFEELTASATAWIDEPGWNTVLAGSSPKPLPLGDSFEVVVIAAPSLEVTLVTRDEAGAPIAGARVAWRVNDGLRARFDRDLETGAAKWFEARTDAAGEWKFATSAGLPLEVQAEAPGYAALDTVLEIEPEPNGGPTRLELVLASAESTEEILSGRVVDAFGLPVAGACVELGRLGTRSDGDGVFRFDLSERDPFDWGGDRERLSPRMTAIAPGWLPVSLDASIDGAGRAIWPPEIELVLLDPPLSISGRVVDEKGAPVADAVVFCPELHLVGNRTTMEAELRGQDEDGEFLVCERTDERGRFEFGGLLDSSYTIAAYVEGSFLRAQVEDVRPAASEVTIRIDRSAVWSKVRGRVLTPQGQPLAGISITTGMVTQVATGPSGSWSTALDGESTLSGPDGSFELTAVPKHFQSVSLEHPLVHFVYGRSLPVEGARENEAGELVDCDLIVEPRLRFQVRLRDPREADAFRVLRADGSEASVRAQSGRRYHSSPEHLLLTEGRSRSLFTDASAVALELLREGVVVRRIELDLAWPEATLVE